MCALDSSGLHTQCYLIGEAEWSEFANRHWNSGLRDQIQWLDLRSKRIEEVSLTSKHLQLYFQRKKIHPMQVYGPEFYDKDEAQVVLTYEWTRTFSEMQEVLSPRNIRDHNFRFSLLNFCHCSFCHSRICHSALRSIASFQSKLTSLERAWMNIKWYLCMMFGCLGCVFSCLSSGVGTIPPRLMDATMWIDILFNDQNETDNFDLVLQASPRILVLSDHTVSFPRSSPH